MTHYDPYADLYVTASKVVLVAVRDVDAADILRILMPVTGYNKIVIVSFGEAVPTEAYTHAFLLSEPETVAELNWWHDQFKPACTPNTKLFDLAAP